jgi:hypothetical protein
MATDKEGAVNKALLQDLKDIAGSEDVITGAQALDVFAQAGGKKADLIRVMPSTADEVAAVVKKARAHGQKVFSVRTRVFPETLEGQSGILIDPVKLNEIIKIDKRNLMAHIGAGVTFDQLEKELVKQDLCLLMPGSAESPYVVRSYLERDILVGSVTFRQPNLSIFHAIMANGEKWISGSQQLSVDGANFREDQGPQFSPLFGGSEDIYGIPVFGIVYIYPRKSKRQLFAYSFKKLEDAVSFTGTVSRREHCFEIAGGDGTWWSSILGKAIDLPDWTVLMSIEQHPALVANQAAQVTALAKDLGAKALGKDELSVLGQAFGRPWNLYDRGGIKGCVEAVKYYTFAEKVPVLFATSDAVLQGTQVGKGFIPVYFGSAFFCESDIHHVQADAGKAKDLRLKAYAKLLEKRALIDRGNGKLAEMVYAKANPVTVNMVKTFKRLLDPDSLINPGQLMEGL